MSYRDVMETILPAQGATHAHITGHYGEIRRKGPHGGSDFNYVGGQSGVNLKHPTVHSPVEGEVVLVGGRFGTVSIRDSDGNLHQLLHTQTQTVKVGQHVAAGDAIATMGGRGPGGAADYAQHVHYQMKSRNGHGINPEQYWDSRAVNAVGVHAATPASSAIHDVTRAAHRGAVTHGPRATEVETAQSSLNRLHVTDGKGHTLAVDGDLGPRTGEAIRSFQRMHGLSVNGGLDGPTRKAIDTAERALLSHPDHPHHPLFEQSLAGVRQMECERGIASGRHSEHVAGAVTVQAVREGLQRVDRVELNDSGSLVRGVQVGMRDETALNRSTQPLETAQAARQTVAESSRQVHDVEQRRQAQVEQQNIHLNRPHAANMQGLAPAM